MVRLGCIVAAAAAVHSAAFGADSLVTLTAGVDYSSGDYGRSETTSVSALHAGAKYETGRWTYRLTAPYVRISGPANVVGLGGETVVLPGEAEGRRSVSGLGDVGAGAAYRLVAERTAPLLIELGAKIKLATADESKGLGTGKNDYAVQAEFFKPVGAFAPFATLGYRWYGDPPGTELRNALYGSVGIAHRDESGSTVGFAYDFRQRIVAGGERVSDAMLFLSYPLAPEWKAQLYFVKGFSDASPDAGVGAVLGYSF